MGSFAQDDVSILGRDVELIAGVDTTVAQHRRRERHTARVINGRRDFKEEPR